MRPPEFWYDGEGSPWPGLLSPLAALYGAASRVNNRLITGRRAPLPVICVGNLVAGGAGKTPVALALAGHLQSAGRSPHFISRGFGGAKDGVRVDPAIHGAGDVGDEADDTDMQPLAQLGGRVGAAEAAEPPIAEAAEAAEPAEPEMESSSAVRSLPSHAPVARMT